LTNIKKMKPKAEIPRLRMFAGPNGSGKTTIKNGLNFPSSWFGIYINPDELEMSIRTNSEISLESFNLSFTEDELKSFFKTSPLLIMNELNLDSANAIQLKVMSLSFKNLNINSYHMSVLADFLRHRALLEKKSFTFETVMSHPDKAELLKYAQQIGYRTYLYFIATEDPEINIYRVKNRISQGGHAVPNDKIVERYYRSIDQLPKAIQYANRAFLFDTSEAQSKYFCSCENGKIVQLEVIDIPAWFQEIIDKIRP
tara:strand:+ start:10024 stop:10791 length:768 start_codon:yes stop_codon:yes gene_type:complete